MDGQSSSQEGSGTLWLSQSSLNGVVSLFHILPSCILAPRWELGPFPCWMCPSFQGSVFIPNPCVRFKWRTHESARAPFQRLPVVFSLSDISHTCLLRSFFPAQAVSSLSHEIMFYWEKDPLRNTLEVPKLPVSPQILSFLSSGRFC